MCRWLFSCKNKNCFCHSVVIVVWRKKKISEWNMQNPFFKNANDEHLKKARCELHAMKGSKGKWRPLLNVGWKKWKTSTWEFMPYDMLEVVFSMPMLIRIIWCEHCDHYAINSISICSTQTIANTTPAPRKRKWAKNYKCIWYIWHIETLYQRWNIKGY